MENLDKQRQAAERGDAQAQYQLACCLERGDRRAEAAEWFLRAAQQGHRDAQHGLGVRYATGAGVPQDFRESFKWHRKAAEAGLLQSQCELGKAYQAGLGVDPDWDEASKWWRQAAERGHVPAMLNLARLHDEPDPLYDDVQEPVTLEEALDWLQKAAAAGNLSAMAQLEFWRRAVPEAAAAGG